MSVIYDKTNTRTIGDYNLEGLLANVWVNAKVDGTSNSSYNVSSLTDVGTGQVGVNYTAAFTTSDYVALVCPQIVDTSSGLQGNDTANLSSSRTDFWFRTAAGAEALTDPTNWNIVIYGVTV